MRTTHWKLFFLFLLGLLVMLAVGCGVGSVLGANPVLRKLHWGVYLALTVLFPILALILHGKAEGIRSLYLVSYLTNAVGGGCAFGVVLGYLELPMILPVVGMLLLSMAFPAGLALVQCLVSTVCRRDRRVTITFTLLGLAALIGSFFLLMKWNPLVAFGACFGFLFYLPFPIGCGRALSEPWNAEAHLSLSGFGAYIIVVVGAIIVLAEDGLDGAVDGLFEGIADFADVPPDQKKQRPHP